MKELKIESCNSYFARIYIAGDYEEAKRICAKWVTKNNQCVTVTKTDYIYAGGQESGVMVEFINYPRFPVDVYKITVNAKALGDKLLKKLSQRSYSILTPDMTLRYSLGEDKPKLA